MGFINFIEFLIMYTHIIKTTLAVLFSFSITNAAIADNWLKVESNNFIVYSNDSEVSTRKYVKSLEDFNYTLDELYRAKTGDVKENPKFEIFLLKRRDDFKAIRPDIDPYVAGFYKNCSEGAIAYSATDIRENDGANSRRAGDRKKGYNTDLIVLFHEYSHHFMYNTYTTAYPPWFVEGFAEYFSTTRFDGDNKVSIGYVSPDGYQTLMSTKWFNFKDLLNNNIRRETSDDVFLFYAQSWLLSHYILSDSARVRAFAKYLDSSNSGMDVTEAFETHMGLKVNDLEKTLRTYLSKGTPVISFQWKHMPIVEQTLIKLPKSADKLLLWQSSLKTCPRAQYKAALIENIRREAIKWPTDPLAQLSLARAEILIGDVDKALPILQTLKPPPEDTAEASYLLGRYYLAKGQSLTDKTERDAAFKQARINLFSAHQAKPLLAPILYNLALAQSNKPDYPNSIAVDASIQASNLMPSNDTYAIFASTLLIQVDRAPEAAILLQPVANNPHGGQTSKKLSLLINAIKAGKPKAELLDLLREDEDD
jgi:hypothetical protein